MMLEEGLRMAKKKGACLTGITTNGVLGVQLVGHIGVVLAGTALADSGLHQT
jgi:hypothetical protein